ncbi:MAG: hypothetical protein JNM68_01115 [Dinghuibacter sp.]|nr:hypothetical protein [Dinghuibacter sp.]
MKIFKYLFLLLPALYMNAQAQVVTIIPASFSAEDEVTVRVDLTGTPVAASPQPYIWIWCETNNGGGNDGVTNGTWGNSSDGAKFTRVGATGNIWEFKFVGTTMFNRTPGELKQFGFLVKCKDGTCQTPDQKWFKFDPLIFLEGQFRNFPAKVAQNDVVTVYHKKSLATDVNVQRMTETSVSVTLFDQNDAPIQTINNIAVRAEANGLMAASFVPENLVTLPPGVTIKKIEYKFKGTGLNTSGAVVPVETGAATVDMLPLQ